MASKTKLLVHIVWITKYRRKVLTADIKVRCRELIRQGCDSHDVTILSGVVACDHIHLLVKYPAKLSVSKLVKDLKGRSSIKLQEEFQSIKNMLWAHHMWASGYGAWSVGDQTKELVAQYLLHHQHIDNEQDDKFIIES